MARLHLALSLLLALAVPAAAAAAAAGEAARGDRREQEALAPVRVAVSAEAEVDQLHAELRDEAKPPAEVKREGQRDLAFMHIPYNFGHSIEKAALSGHDMDRAAFWAAAHHFAPYMDDEGKAVIFDAVSQPDREVWGTAYQKAHATSEVTGCPLYYTPGKHWPAALAEEYFGSRQIFGVLRNPFERLSAMFRGSSLVTELSAGSGDYGNYGVMNPELRKVCDLDGAVFELMSQLVNGSLSKYAGECCWLQQSEYFDGPYGIDVPVDNILFPQSMNEILAERGYPASYQMAQEDIFHVGGRGCDHVWAADLKPATRALVKQFYAKDFELLCKHFGYCDIDENVCLPLIDNMCPPHVNYYPK